MSPSPRVRIAPAPSGFLHVGSVRTALYNWLHARRHGGQFIVRIEDTDASRATTESMESMLDAMSWVGLDWDEGPRNGGPYGPYRQSERAALYAAVARRLEEAGYTYRDHRTQDELAAWREAQRAADRAPTVKAPAEGDHYGDPANPAVLRLKLPTTGSITITDLVRGDVTWQWANVADPVLVRSDGSSTYPLANTVDDVAMGLTLICRGEDLLSSTPKQAFLYETLTTDGLIDEALGEAGLPARDPAWSHPTEFAHLSMIVGQDRKKLSKRHGSVAIQEFARLGYLPETLLNYLALLGWAPPEGQERMTVDEMVASFDFAQVGKAAAAFDQDKLTAFNGERIRDLEPDQLSRRLVPYLDGTYSPQIPAEDEPDTLVPDPEWEPLIDQPPSDEDLALLRGLVPLVQERMQRLDEIQGYAPAFFADEVTYDEKSVKKVLHKAGADEVLEAAIPALADLDDWTADAIEGVLRPLADQLDRGFGKIAQPVRVATTGTSVSPPLFESLELMPRQRVLARLRDGLDLARAGQS